MSPKPATTAMDPMMQRRKATQKELEQGQREIEAAQRRLDQQVKEEVALEDKKAEGDSKEAQSRFPPEEKMERVKALTEGPQFSIAAAPEEIRPLENATEEPGVTKETKVAVSAEAGQHGVGSLEKSVAPVSDPKMSEPPHMSTPMTPLFDENQLRRFQELYAQAPWLYPQHVPQAPLPLMPPGQLMPPVQRPLFFEQDERRMHEEGRIGSSGYYGHDRSIDVDRENQELRKNIGNKLRENQFLREGSMLWSFKRWMKTSGVRLQIALMANLKDPPKRRLIDPQRPQRRPRPPRRLIDPLCKGGRDHQGG